MKKTIRKKGTGNILKGKIGDVKKVMERLLKVL